MENNILIYLISGRARNGKDTMSKMLEEEYKLLGKRVCFIQLMRPLKWLLQDYFGWDGKEETKPREKLQKMGTELIREELNMPTYFIDRLTENIKILSKYYDVFMVTDVRLPLEIELLKQRFDHVVSINIIRENFENDLTLSEKVHYTEVALNDYDDFDYVVVNKSLEHLKIKVKEIVSEVENNEKND